MTDSVPFAKGHGTENDFVLLPDHDGSLRLTAEQVVRLSDRRAGIGGDGVIRVVPTHLADEPDVRGQAEHASWFMDYRNADGSVAEMCGNGVRVFARYLRDAGLEREPIFEVATRAGVKRVRFEEDRVAVHMGTWRFSAPELAEEDGFDALVHVDAHDPYSALSVDMGNPHTVVALPETVALDDLDLTREPTVNPDPPDGTNVEFVRPLGPGHIRMRVHERGVGETRSCGTGVCAAALATRFWAGGASATNTWTVDVPGGRLVVRALPNDEVELVGPAVIVAEGTTNLLT
jgi:diaminopimelate epimerase